MELENNDFFRAEQIFTRSLTTVPNVELWSVYLGYVLRRNNLTTDINGTARTTISHAYDFILQKIGQDKEAGRLWHDYLMFIKDGPGIIGGSSWQDQQKVDTLRKMYQRAIAIPLQGQEIMWKEYNDFEIGLNKILVRMIPVICKP
jgi:cleavage stimulation factor subunit 3